MGLTLMRVGRWLSGRYPEAWRQRHGADLDEYLDVRGVRRRDLLSLFLGLLDAHAQVLSWKEWWPTMNRHLTRGLVLSAAAVILLLVEAGALAKASEDGAVAALEHHDSGAWLGLTVVELGAALAAIVVALASLRAVVQVARRLLDDGDVAGLAALAAPVLICAGLLIEVLVIARTIHGHQALAVAVLAASGLVGVLVALWCLAVALRRAEASAVPARTASPAAVVLASLGIVCLLGEVLWASRIATLPGWSRLAGVVSLPVGVTFAGAAVCSVAAVVLALVARSEIGRADLA